MPLSVGNKSDKKHFPALTRLRFLLVLVIVYFHTYPLVGMENPGKVISLVRQLGGFFGNHAFFCLSGFLIAHTYKQRIMNREMTFPQFLKRRLIKIYPLYFVSAIVSMFVQFYFNRFQYVNLDILLQNLLMISNSWIGDIYWYNSPLWFFCVTLMCYILYYALCAKTNNKRNVYIYISVGAVLWGYVLMLKGWDYPFMYPRTGEGLHSFFVGVLLYEAYQRLSNRTLRKLYFTGLAGVVFLLVLSYCYGFSAVIGEKTLFFTLLVGPGLVLSATLFSFNEQNIFRKLVTNLGKGSMSLIVWHCPLYAFAYFKLYSSGMFFNQYVPVVRHLVYVAVLSVICCISYFLIEKRFDKYLRRKFLEPRTTCITDTPKQETGV